MNALRQIKIIASPGGGTTISVDGVKGQSCTDVTADFENVLGEQVEERTLKPEYYHQEDKHLHIENDDE